MRNLKTYKKLFYDLEKAKLFGQEIEKSANEIIVKTGKRTYCQIFGGTENLDKNHKIIGNHHYIDIEKGVDGQDIYYVKYSIGIPLRASKIEALEAQELVVAQLNQEYQKLGPSTDISPL